MTAPDGDAALASTMDELWERWRPEELARVQVIELAVAALQAGALDEIKRRHAEDEAHRLAGSLGALGLPDGCSSARELERRFVRTPRPHEVAELSELVGSVRAVLETIGRR